MLLFVLSLPTLAQDKLTLEVNAKRMATREINPLSPAKAAFYSAVLPGLGQAYNKKYWKVPLVYAALGTGLYFYINNDRKYNQYRDAYKRRLSGYTDDEFKNIDADRLLKGQRYFQKNKELSLIITVGLYILNVVDASVDAHLLQFNVDENLSLRPDYFLDDMRQSPTMGLSLNYQF